MVDDLGFHINIERTLSWICFGLGVLSLISPFDIRDERALFGWSSGLFVLIFSGLNTLVMLFGVLANPSEAFTGGELFELLNLYDILFLVLMLTPFIVKKRKIKVLATLLLIVSAITIRNPIPVISSDKVVSMDGFGLYLSYIAIIIAVLLYATTAGEFWKKRV